MHIYRFVFVYMYGIVASDQFKYVDQFFSNFQPIDINMCMQFIVRHNFRIGSICFVNQWCKQYYVKFFCQWLKKITLFVIVLSQGH